MNFFSNCWVIFKISECESCIAVKKYCKISLVVMVSLWPLVINSIFFLLITITTRDIFQYFLSAMHDYFNQRQVFCEIP